MWATGPREVGEAFEKTLSKNAFKLALGKGAQMVRHNGTPESVHEIIRRITKNHPATLPIDEHKDSIDITTIEAISREPDEQAEQHQDELKRAEEGVVQALKEKDEVRKQLEEGGRIVQGWMDGINKRLEGQEVRMGEMEREAKERERTEAEYKQQLADLTLRLQDATSTADRAKLEQVNAEHNQQLADINHRLGDMANASAADQPRLEQVVKEGEVAKADYEQRLVDLERRLRDMASEADRAREQHRAELKERDEKMKQTLEERMKELQGQIEWVKKDSEELKTRRKEQEATEREPAEAALADINRRLQEAIDASASDRAILAELLKERDRVDAERKQQLADLTCHLRNEVAHRVALEKEMEELRDRVATAATVPPRVPPRPTPCVQNVLSSAAHDG